MDNVNKADIIERYCALIIGILFLVLGVAGFIPGLVSLPGTTASYVPIDATKSAYAMGFGYVFGLFPTNFLHNIVHCAVGLLGIASYTSTSSARIFNRSFAVAYTLLSIMGLLPLAKTTFGLMPLFGNNVWLNALTATVAAYYGSIIQAKVRGTTVLHEL
ncbi:DUF4383 domain-containing protein [Brasilonema bromeliae]|uniref:DUF4383 domain-containing protein n=1 Tax=Brasilonema bromeliae SPC951 TaxID=385972 RepID=A0ABX1PA02_9CYAN|nr:DUF4383 domain-containing protein [Brasilonema bromeliae]NMG21124.1 DUF4383 domain-containing protein [Brasilonema bromeliae SPC951]